MKKEVKKAIKSAVKALKKGATNCKVYEDATNLVRVENNKIIIRHDSGCYFYAYTTSNFIIREYNCVYDRRYQDNDIQKELIKFKYEILFEVEKNFLDL